MPGSSRWQAFALSFNFSAALATIVANKYALRVFPFPAALTALHYCFSWTSVRMMRTCGVFKPGHVQEEQKVLFYTLIFAWALCNALSNASLSANSVGFYQLMKVLTTPLVAAIDVCAFGKRISRGKVGLLILACVGVAIATVSDVQLNRRGTVIAICSVMTGVVQKVLNEHMQQRGGLSSLQLMDAAFPAMTLIGVCVVPLMDPIMKLFRWHVTGLVLGRVLLSGCVGVLINISTTLVLGATGALALVLLGQLKTCSVLIAGMLLFDAPQTWRGLAGAALGVGSIATYTLLKYCEKRQQQAAADREDVPLLMKLIPNVYTQTGWRGPDDSVA